MERRIVLAALLALSACAEPPPLNAILSPLVDVHPDGADLVVDVHPIDDAGGYVVRFTKAKGFPSSIKLGNDEIIAPRTDDSCPAETLVGTALFPITTVAGEIEQDGNANVDIELYGPAIARTRMTYTVPYTSCDGQTQMLSGSATFTFFPFGRIARHDDVTANQVAITAPATCTCTSPSYFFTSYWTFPVGVTPVGPDNLPITSEGSYLAADACFDQGAAIRVGVHWSDTRTRILSATIGTQVRFVYDFVMERAILPGNTHGVVDSHVTLDRVPFGMCNDVLAAVRDADVRVDDRAALLDSSGIYADSGGYGKTVTIKTSQTTAPGFAISLGGVYEHMRVKRSNTEGQYYVPQLDRDNGRTLVWFRDPLPPTETAEIELLE